MNKFVTAIVFALSLGLATSALASERSITLKVKGWSCGGCSTKTAKALESIDGVNKVDSRLDAGTIEVSFDDEKVTADQLKAAVKNAGFEAS